MKDEVLMLPSIQLPQSEDLQYQVQGPVKDLLRFHTRTMATTVTLLVDTIGSLVAGQAPRLCINLTFCENLKNGWVSKEPVTLPGKINMEPKIHPTEKENHVPNLHKKRFQPLIFQGVLCAFSRGIFR